MSRIGQRTILLLVVSVMLAVGSRGQELPGQAFPNLIRANERFGRTLLSRVHADTPDRNVALSPISVSLVLAALQSGTVRAETSEEIRNALGWGAYDELRVSSRMLLVTFEKPAPAPPPRRAEIGAPRPPPIGRPEAAWISNTVLYRSPNVFSARFMDNAEKYFGMKFASTGTVKPRPEDLRQARGDASALPKTLPWNDVWINSGTHLQTRWRGNMSKPFDGAFKTRSGRRIVVPMLTTELSTYHYAKTDGFEAVALRCNRAYFVAVLPAPGRDVLELERELAASHDAVSAALRPRPGIVDLPPFRIQFETDLRPQLEALGIKQIFEDLRLFLGAVVDPGS